MTIQNPPIFIQAGSHPAEDVRRWMDAMVESTAGVVAAGDLAVTENGTPNMSVEVAAGRGFVAGDEATYQGMYAFENRGTTNVVISASDPTNPRVDLIVVRVRDAAYSGATNTVAIEVVTGTAAASPVAPTVPDNCLLLATVAVAALATSITNANITDNRTRAYALGVSELRNLGVKALATANVNLGPTSLVVTDSGLSVTWTADPTRMYRTSVTGGLFLTNASATGQAVIATDANVQRYRYVFTAFTNNVGGSHYLAAVESGLSGSQTRKVRFGLLSGAGSVTYTAGPDYGAYLMVEDVGPA